MKKIYIILCLIFVLFISMNTTINVSADNKQVVNSTDWMGALPDDLKLTDLNIPGVHDAGTAHTTATVTAQYTICQHYYIGNQTTHVLEFFSSWGTRTEPGLLEQGVRYFDIRFDLHDYDPEDEDNEEEIARDGIVQFAANHLELCHGSSTCRYLDYEILGVDFWEDVTGTKLLTWVNDFLTAHNNEVVILELCAEDSDNKDEVYDLCRQLFTNLALEEQSGFPSIYYGNRIPTLGDARGKVFLLADFDGDLGLYNEDEEYLGNWAFKVSYCRGDTKNKTYARSNYSEALKYKAYKNNNYDGCDEDEKWIWVKNGLQDAERIYLQTVKDGYDPLIFLFTSANDISNLGFFRSPQGFAEDINPKVYVYIYNNNCNREWHYYGIIGMDFMNDPRYGEDMATVIWSSNFYRDYNFIDVDFAGIDFEYVDNSPKTATSIGSGNLIVVIIGLVVIAGVIIGSIIIVKHRKKKNNNLPLNNEESNEKNIEK